MGGTRGKQHECEGGMSSTNGVGDEQGRDRQGRDKQRRDEQHGTQEMSRTSLGS